MIFERREIKINKKKITENPSDREKFSKQTGGTRMCIIAEG